MTRANCVLVDLEGTLTDSDHRQHYLDAKDYDIWNEGLCLDLPKVEVMATVFGLSTMGTVVCILTAKPDKYREDVCSWLGKYAFFSPQLILMRGMGDQRKSPVLKRNMIPHVLRAGLNPILAIDDRADVCQMYHETGIRTLQVY